MTTQAYRLITLPWLMAATGATAAQPQRSPADDGAILAAAFAGVREMMQGPVTVTMPRGPTPPGQPFRDPLFQTNVSRAALMHFLARIPVDTLGENATPTTICDGSSPRVRCWFVGTYVTFVFIDRDSSPESVKVEVQWWSTPSDSASAYNPVVVDRFKVRQVTLTKTANAWTVIRVECTAVDKRFRRPGCQ